MRMLISDSKDLGLGTLLEELINHIKHLNGTSCSDTPSEASKGAAYLRALCLSLATYVITPADAPGPQRVAPVEEKNMALGEASALVGAWRSTFWA